MTADGLEYIAGQRFLAAGPRLAVFSSNRELVRAMWPVVRDGGDAAAVLLGILPGGFDALADLVLVERRADSVEILLRGDVDIVIGEGHDAQRVDGRGVRTWRECAASPAATLTVGSAGTAEGRMPLVAGVVAAGGFRGRIGGPGPRTPAETPRGSGPAGVSGAKPAPPPPPPPVPVPVPVPAAGAPDGSTLPNPMTPPTPLDRETPLTPPNPATPLDRGTPPNPQPPAPPAQQPPAQQPPAQQPPSPPGPPAGGLGQTQLGQEDEYGHLFESTVLRSAEDAAVRSDPESADDPRDAAAETPDQDPVDRLGDHDGSTILGGQLAALLRANRESGSAAATGQPSALPARLQLIFSTGQVVTLDRPVVVGRKPQVDRVSGSQIPHLVTVTGPNNDISRSHLELDPDGNSVLAKDLGSTNGTIVIDARGPRPLSAHVAERLAVGARFDLGDGVIIDIRAGA